MIRYFVDQLGVRLAETSPLLQVVLGPRQVGKTTGVRSLLASSGRDSVYASADLPSPPQAEWITEHWQAARAKGVGTILVLDEIQKVARWGDTVKALFDEDRDRGGPRVVLLGSAGLAIQRGLRESLLGRFELIRVPHWSFSECQQAFEWNLDTYLQFGGYPGPVHLIHDVQRWQDFMRDSVIEPIISRDILLLRKIAKPALFRQTFELAMRHPAQEISYQKLLGQLQDRGNATTVKSYLETLEEAFVLRCLSKYSTRARTLKSSTPKLIPLAPALIHAYTKPSKVIEDREWRGRVFEAVIGAFFYRMFRDKLFYWRDGNNEVDFVIAHDDQLFGVEVKSSRARRSGGTTAFTISFGNAKTVMINEQSGAQLLSLDSAEEVLGFLNRIA